MIGKKPTWKSIETIRHMRDLSTCRIMGKEQSMGLIDADALKKDLKSVTLSNGTLVNTNAVLYLLEEYPTAYDVDKVVEQLGKLKKAEQDRPDDCDEDGCGDGEQIYDDGRSQGRFEAFGKAIQIVKGGGVK
jgi:hypothetical protein